MKQRSLKGLSYCVLFNMHGINIFSGTRVVPGIFSADIFQYITHSKMCVRVCVCNYLYIL